MILDVLESLRIDIRGVTVRPGASARFRIEQPRAGRLSFDSDLGVATEPGFASFPVPFLRR